MIHPNNVLAATAGLLMAFPAHAQSTTASSPAATSKQAATQHGAVQDISDSLAAILKEHEVPGMVALVLHGRDEVARGAAGVRKAGGTEAITIDDKFHIGSCTKSMTATLCAMLVEEGMLGWTTTPGEVFPDLKEEMDPAWHRVTLEQLLTHRGGAPEGLDADGLWGRLWEARGTPTDQRLELLRGVTKHAPVSNPGTEFLYSNAGFAMAGAMAERVTGRAWEDLMRERLFGPLGMASAGFGAPGTRDLVDQPWGHGQRGPANPGPRADNPAAIGPGGTVHCSVGDWGKYIALHLDGDSAEGARLLKPETFTKLHTPFNGPEPKYAMGWGIDERPWAKGTAPGDHGLVLRHAGSNTMWLAVVWVAPEKDCAVLIACNDGREGADKVCDAAAKVLVERFIQPR